MARTLDVRVLFLGCGDLGTGAAHRLFGAGFRVAIVELARPLAVRRRVVFAEAARAGATWVEGVECRRLELQALRGAWPTEFVPLCVAPIAAALERLAPRVVVDARMAKRDPGPPLPATLLRIALGPGRVAGADCDAVVETLRGPGLGQVIWRGSANPDTGEPGELGGETAKRILRSPATGMLRLRVQLGDPVSAGEAVGSVGGVPVLSALSGRVRGLLADGDLVGIGQKLGDVDPRPDAPPPDRISDKARTVAEGVLRAIVERLQISLSPDA